MRLTRGRIIIGVVVLSVAAYLTWPGLAELDYTTCQPKDGFSQLSETIYGRFFWERALANADDLAAGLEKLNQDWQNRFDAANRQRERDERPDPLDPRGPPTASERAAQRLRDQADQIEDRQALNDFLSTNRPIIANARHCEQVITEKLRTM